MDAHELRRALRRGWTVIACVTLTCVVAALTYSHRVEPRYESKAQIFVGGGKDIGAQRAASYADVATSPSVTSQVVRQLGLAGSAEDLAGRLRASSPSGTMLIDVSAADSDPRRAQRIATAITSTLADYVPQLERSKQADSPVHLYTSTPASLPTSPVSPDTRLNVAAGLVIGLLLGVLAAVARQRLDRRIVGPDDLPHGPGHSVLADVPSDETLATAPAAALRAMRAGRADALRELRTNLRFLDRDDEHSGTIAVTSSISGEGASTTAFGLAMAIAEAGSRVILVEANLRDPVLARRLGLHADDGVSRVLAGAIPVDPVLQRLPTSAGPGSLRVIGAGPMASNPSELLSSDRLPALLEDLRARCDTVVIDAPPLLSASEAAIVAAAADGVIVVVALGRITRPELDRTLGTLTRADARVLGLVTNRPRWTARRRDRGLDQSPAMSPPDRDEPTLPEREGAREGPPAGDERASSSRSADAPTPASS